MKELLVNKLNEKAKQLNKKLTTCRSVKRLLAQKAWKTVIQPLIDETIADTIGGKKGSLYRKNLLTDPDTKNKEYYIGYKQALMDLHNRVWNYPESIELLKNQIKLLEKKAKQPEKYSVPMTEGKYAGDDV